MRLISANGEQLGIKHIREAMDYAERMDLDLVEVDDSQSSMQKKVRENARQKIPYLLIVGDQEAGEGTVNVRRRGDKRQEAVAAEAFAGRVLREAAARDPV